MVGTKILAVGSGSIQRLVEFGTTRYQFCPWCSTSWRTEVEGQNCNFVCNEWKEWTGTLEFLFRAAAMFLFRSTTAMSLFHAATVFLFHPAAAVFIFCLVAAVFLLQRREIGLRTVGDNGGGVCGCGGREAASVAAE